MPIRIVRGDITQVNLDAIVNAANERMLGGGGVDGAIHRAAGPELLKACRAVPETQPGVRCPTGEARITPGFGLPAEYVIHTVGPIYQDASRSSPFLVAAYSSCLKLARDRGIQSIAFPAISCGVYGYPLVEAARIAMQTCEPYVGCFEEIRFVLFSDRVRTAWESVSDQSRLGA